MRTCKDPCGKKKERKKEKKKRILLHFDLVIVIKVKLSFEYSNYENVFIIIIIP